jgi:hypothetical protein
MADPPSCVLRKSDEPCEIAMRSSKYKIETSLNLELIDRLEGAPRLCLWESWNM